MQPGERDAALLADMLKACDDIIAITAGLQEKAFLADRVKCLAVERCSPALHSWSGKEINTPSASPPGRT